MAWSQSGKLIPLSWPPPMTTITTTIFIISRLHTRRILCRQRITRLSTDLKVLASIGGLFSTTPFLNVQSLQSCHSHTRRTQSQTLTSRRLRIITQTTVICWGLEYETRCVACHTALTHF